MKKILFIIGILFCFVGTASAQYPWKINLEPYLDRTVEHIMVSQTEANANIRSKKYARNGQYKSVLKSEFVSEILDQVPAPVKPYKEYTATYEFVGVGNPVLQDVLVNDFDAEVTLTRGNVGTYELQLDGGAGTEFVRYQMTYDYEFMEDIQGLDYGMSILEWGWVGQVYIRTYEFTTSWQYYDMPNGWQMRITVRAYN